MRAITRDSTPARRKGIEVATTTICPLPPRKQKGHAHHSHPHTSLTSANKSIENLLHYHSRWERYSRRGNLNFMRRHQSCHNYHLPSLAQETERPRPRLSPACFTHKCPQIYRELFPLPPSLGKIQAERQPLILCVGIKVVTTTHVPFALSRPGNRKATPTTLTSILRSQVPTNL